MVKTPRVDIERGASAYAKYKTGFFLIFILQENASDMEKNYASHSYPAQLIKTRHFRVRYLLLIMHLLHPITSRFVGYALGLCTALLCFQSAHAQVESPRYTFTRVVDTTTIFPDGGTYNWLASFSLSVGRVVFSAAHSRGPLIEGIFSAPDTGGAVTKIATVGAAAPGVGGAVFGNLRSRSLIGDNTPSNSNVVFVADYSGGAGTSGVFTGSNTREGVLSLVAQAGVGAPESTPHGAFSSFSRIAVGGSNAVAFQATVGRGRNATNGIFTVRTGGPVVAVATTQGDRSEVPGGGVFSRFTGLGMSGDAVAFVAQYTGGAGTSGIFISRDGVLSPMVQNIGENGPGGSTLYNFQGPALNGTIVAFLCSYMGGTGTNSFGIFSCTSSGEVTTIATNSSGAAPDVPGGGTFSTLMTPRFSGTTVVFLANYRGGMGKSGIFAYKDGVLRSVIREGDTQFGSPIATLSVGDCQDGSIVFGYTLADGKEGIAVAHPVATAR